MVHHACNPSMKEAETGRPASATYTGHILGIQAHLGDLHVWAAEDRYVHPLSPLCVFKVRTGNGAAELGVAWVSYCQCL